MGVEPRRRRPPFEGYGLSESEDGMLSWGWAVERLVAARNYWVSTTRPDGRPHAMPVWGVWLDDGFFFGSGRHSAKSRNPAANSAIVVHLESGDVVPPKRAYAWDERTYPSSATQFDFD